VHYSEGTAMPAAKNLAARKVMPLAEFVNKNLAAGKLEIDKIISEKDYEKF